MIQEEALLEATGSKLHSGAPTSGGITNRELGILFFVATGAQNSVIALALSLSEKTIKNHITRIFEKLNVDSRCAAAIIGSQRFFPVEDVPVLTASSYDNLDLAKRYVFTHFPVSTKRCLCGGRQ